MPRQIACLRFVDLAVALERRHDPSLAGRPVVVGGRADQPGVVVAASREARAAGVVVGQPLIEAARRCPTAVFLPGAVDHYLDAGATINEVLSRTFARVECDGLDEVYATAHTGNPGVRVALERVCADLSGALACQVACGIASTKITARAAACLAAPSGLLFVFPAYEARFLAGLPVATLAGIDTRASATLKGAGIHDVAALAQLDSTRAIRLLGRSGPVFVRLARGEDPRDVLPGPVTARLVRRASVEVSGGAAAVLDLAASLAGELYDALVGLGSVAGVMQVALTLGDTRTVAAASRLPGGRPGRGALIDAAVRLSTSLCLPGRLASAITIRLLEVRETTAAEARPSSCAKQAGVMTDRQTRATAS
jgi:DNA polymerase-4